MSDAAKPRILFLNRSYWPDNEATGQLLTALCEGLADDFDVHVLAGCPNVTTCDADWTNTNQRNGVTIHRVKHTTWPKSNMLMKAANFLSFAFAAQRQIFKVPQPDVVVFETDPFLLPFVADRLHRKTGCSMIGYLQDIYPDVAVALGKVSNNWFIRTLRKKLFNVYSRCQRMVVLSTDMRQLLLDAEIPGDRIEIIPNWADTDAIVPIPREDNLFLKRHNLSDKFVVMYSGNLGLTQRLDEFIDAAALLQNDPDIQFVFVGNGARKADLQQQVARKNLTNVLFCDYQPLSELSHSLSAADLHLIPLTAELSRCLMPSKLYGILAAGRAYLTNAPKESELHQLTKTHEVGLTVDAGSPQRIAAGISDSKAVPESIAMMGLRARRLAKSYYTKEHATVAFTRLLQNISERPNDTKSCVESA
ncbi:MAG: glycosyltransferase family 4 protein [Planctomycetaceae bacterium]